YQSLANATFTVGDLMASADVASLDELLALELTGSEYLSLLGDTLSDGGDSSAAAVLMSLAGSVGAGVSLTLGDMIDAAAGLGDDAFDAQLNALDMLAVGAQV